MAASDYENLSVSQLNIIKLKVGEWDKKTSFVYTNYVLLTNLLASIC